MAIHMEYKFISLEDPNLILKPIPEGSLNPTPTLTNDKHGLIIKHELLEALIPPSSPIPIIGQESSIEDKLIFTKNMLLFAKFSLQHLPPFIVFSSFGSCSLILL